MSTKVAFLATRLLSVSACAADGRSEYEATPIEAGAYSLRVTTFSADEDRHKDQLARRASAICDGPYDLVVKDEIVSVCADACADFRMTTIATLSCEKPSA